MSSSGRSSRGYLLTRSTTWLLTRAGNQRTRSRQAARSPTWAGAAAMTFTAPGPRPASAAEARTWLTNQRMRSGVADLEHRPVGDPAGQLERDRPVAGDPDRQPVAPGPGQLEHRPLVLDRPALDEGPDDVDRLLEVLHRGRRLAEDPPGGVAPPDPEVHPAAADLVEDGQRGGGHRRLAGGRVRDAGPEAEGRGRCRPSASGAGTGRATGRASRTASRSRSRPPRPGG